MFRIQEFQDEVFPGREKEPPAPPESQRGDTPGFKQPGTPAAELRSRIGSDPPSLESEVQDEPGGAFFRARSRSAPPILWAAMRYGRELRRMSDEFDVALQVLPRPKSAGTASQLHRGSSWKEIFQAWLGHRPARDAPRRAPSDCSPLLGGWDWPLECMLCRMPPSHRRRVLQREMLGAGRSCMGHIPSNNSLLPNPGDRQLPVSQ
ncbi:bcl2-associated agonist of cell death [Emydura macquarii macquarii]|uniref:bcl2-associated agonist of cell death n=1 Tax=Emydura macquarii macquarii TaxID=1129001 RepID=UPI00352B2393